MRLQLTLIILVFASLTTAVAQEGSEILLFEAKIKKGKVTLSNPVNITNHPGYDNQPYFHAVDPLLYFSSFDEQGRADLKSYNFKTKVTANITTTSEREYSPTLTPDRKYLSCIIQRDDGAQDLGKYPIEGGDPFVIINSLKVGYHAWADDSHLALFVLEPEEKNSLHFLRLPTKRDTIVATNIGRSLNKIPGERAVSFIQRGESQFQVMRLNTETLVITVITPTIARSEHVAWTPNGLLLTSDGTRLYVFDPAKSKEGWKDVEVKSGGDLLKGVTRLAVSADGKHVAVVVSE